VSLESEGLQKIVITAYHILAIEVLNRLAATIIGRQSCIDCAARRHLPVKWRHAPELIFAERIPEHGHGFVAAAIQVQAIEMIHVATSVILL